MRRRLSNENKEKTLLAEVCVVMQHVSRAFCLRKLEEINMQLHSSHQVSRQQLSGTFTIRLSVIAQKSLTRLIIQYLTSSRTMSLAKLESFQQNWLRRRRVALAVESFLSMKLSSIITQKLMLARR
jgi:hypothetical protein